MPYKPFEEFNEEEQEEIINNTKKFINNNLCIKGELINELVVNTLLQTSLQTTDFGKYACLYRNSIIGEYTKLLDCIRMELNLIRRDKKLEQIQDKKNKVDVLKSELIYIKENREYDEKLKELLIYDKEEQIKNLEYEMWNDINRKNQYENKYKRLRELVYNQIGMVGE